MNNKPHAEGGVREMMALALPIDADRYEKGHGRFYLTCLF